MITLTEKSKIPNVSLGVLHPLEASKKEDAEYGILEPR